MPTLETLNFGTGANLPTTALGGDASTREKAKNDQTYDVEDSVIKKHRTEQRERSLL